MYAYHRVEITIESVQPSQKRTAFALIYVEPVKIVYFSGKKFKKISIFHCGQLEMAPSQNAYGGSLKCCAQPPRITICNGIVSTEVDINANNYVTC